MTDFETCISPWLLQELFIPWRVGQFPHRRQMRRHPTPHCHTLFPDPSLQGWAVPCLLLLFSDSTARQTQQHKSIEDLQGQVGSRALQCLGLLPSLPMQWILAAKAGSHHLHLCWSFRLMWVSTPCILPRRTWEARNCLLISEDSWRKKQSPSPCDTTRAELHGLEAAGRGELQ